MEHFKISVNVGALAKATFKLMYEELLKRQLGNYELYLRVKPQGLVENFQISVDIFEPQGISFLKAVGTFISNELTDIVQVNRTDTKAHIEFKPTVNQQRSCPNCLETLLNGDMVITYDVKRESSAGELQVINGYFVHYFAPPSLQRIPKNVVFVIDRSGSMYGNKIKQTYEAFLKILEDVPQEDYIAILTFDDKVDKWKKQLVQAVPENIRTAKEFVKQINARGGTDINKALLTATKMLTNATFNSMLPEVSASIIIFLSDGEPTSGTTNHGKIIENVKRSLEGRASLYCLGFGSDVDYNFLEKLALQNGGLARRIYEDSDSALQLQGFYNEVAYPMLLNVHLQYLDNSVDYLTQNSFKLYYQGSEIIVAGLITNNSLDVLRAEVTARGVSKPFSEKLEANVNEEVEKEQHYIFGNFIERLWAYLTIEQLMTRQISLEGEDKREVMDKALNLSLKYNFVTPLTSLVVTRPEEEDKNNQMVANKPNEGDQKYDDFGEGPGVMAAADNIQDSHYYVDYDSVNEEEANIGRTNTIQVIAVTEAPPVLKTFHVLLKEPKASKRLCIQISRDEGAYVNLLHDANIGITLNGKLENDKSFAGFGLLNSKLGVRVNIEEDNVTVTQNSSIKAYNWTSSFELDGFLKKDGERIIVTITGGVIFTIFKVQGSFRLSAILENQHSSTDHTSGVIGQLLNSGKTSIYRDTIRATDMVFTLDSLTNYNFTAYGAEDNGSCLHIRLDTWDLLTTESNIVSNIFTVP